MYQINPEEPPSHLADSASAFTWSLVHSSRRAEIDAIAGTRLSACVARGGCVSPRVARACIGGGWARERPFLSCVTAL
jgi:hypothetical protein